VQDLKAKGLTLTEISLRTGIPRSTIANWLYKRNKPRCLHNFRRISPNLKMTEDLAYVLGVLKGDGCAFIRKDGNGEIVLTVSQRKFADSFSKALLRIGLNPHIKEGKMKGWGKKQAFIVTAYSKTFVEWYKNLNLTIETFTMEKSVIAFIKGFYESEGNIYKPKRCRFPMLSMFNSNRNLVKLVQQLLSKIGIHSCLYRCRNGVYRLQVHRKNDSLKFLTLIKPVIKKG
jgi:intein-encoded DNA endonuclease-like protein